MAEAEWVVCLNGEDRILTGFTRAWPAALEHVSVDRTTPGFDPSLTPLSDIESLVIY